MLKGIFIMNEIKIDAADTSRLKLKITVSINLSFLVQLYLRSFLKDDMLPYCQWSLHLSIWVWLITTFFGADQKKTLFSKWWIWDWTLELVGLLCIKCWRRNVKSYESQIGSQPTDFLSNISQLADMNYLHQGQGEESRRIKERPLIIWKCSMTRI